MEPDNDGAAADETVVPHLPGYQALHRLGRGASGEVWAVRDADGVRFAAKLVPAGADLDYEVDLLRSVEHQHVVRLLDVVLDDAAGVSRVALILELAEGGSLADALALRGVLTAGELVTVLCPLGRALHDLHALGLMHGDLSPGNVLFTQRGKPLIADLGMARLAGHVEGEIWATEAWAAPEVLAGSPATPASDVYSLGAIAWCALTGRPPEPAALRPDLADLAAEVPSVLRDLVTASLAHTPAARPLAGEFALRLWECADPEPAPIQGSPARRAQGPADDPAAALTRRVRREAASDAPRRGDASDIGAAVRAGSTRAGGSSAAAARRSRSVRRVAVAAAVVLTVGISGTVAARALNSGSGTTRNAGTTASAATAATATRGPATAKESSSVRRSATAQPEALGSAPVRVIQALASARAKAWDVADPAALGTALAADSVAMHRDRRSLQVITQQDAQYVGLSYRVRSATVQQGGGTVVHVRAVIDRPAYVVHTPRGATRVAAARQHTDLSLVWTSGGWRIGDWSAV